MLKFKSNYLPAATGRKLNCVIAWQDSIVDSTVKYRFLLDYENGRVLKVSIFHDGVYEDQLIGIPFFSMNRARVFSQAIGYYIEAYERLSKRTC